jgi:O-antigen/teichoic acid export membrane protein
MLFRPKPIIGVLLGRGGDRPSLSHERYRRAALTGITAAASKIVSLGTSLLTVRLTYRYLGAERYGMWMTITSVVTMLGFADLGLSNGLVNILADTLGRGDRIAARRMVASAFWMLSAVGVMLTLGAAAALPFVDSSRWFNVHSALAMRESGPALLVFFLCFVLNLPLGAVRGTQMGMQKAFVSNLWNIGGSFLSLLALLFAMRIHAGLPLLVLCLSGPPLLASLINGVELFGWSNPELTPVPRAFSRDAARRLFQTGVMFFLLQLSFSVGMQSDNVVIAQIMGASAVAAYAIPARLFNLIPSFLVMVSSSMWPAYTDALARSDGPWIRRSFRRVLLSGTAICGTATVILVVLGNWILRAWVGPQVHAPLPLLMAFGAQCMLYVYLQPVTFLLNGLGQMRVQVVTSIAAALVNLALSILLVKHYGIIGAVLGTAISALLVLVFPLTIVMSRSLYALDGRQTMEPSTEL